MRLMARAMSDAEIRRRKKLQGHISQTTGALGLASLGAFTASKAPGAKILTKTPRLRRIGASRAMNAIHPEKAKSAALGLSTAGLGIGGAGSFNFASYTGAESKKRARPVVAKPKEPMGKSLGVEMGYYGEEGRPVKLPEIKVPIEKAWSPTANNYDSERSREKRAKVYEGGALVGAGAGGAYAAHHGAKAVQHGRKFKLKDLKAHEMSPVSRKKVNAAGDVVAVPHWQSPGVLHTVKAVPEGAIEPFRGAVRHGGKAAAGVAAVGAAAGIHGAIKRKRKDSWQPYAKRDVSAFGVDHEVSNGQHRETEN